VISPLLSNLYLNEVDRMLEKAVDTTRRGKYTNIQYARFADDMVILIDAERRSDWLVKAVNRRLREEFAKLGVVINEDKSRMVDLKKGESFTFLGFEYRRILSLRRKWRPYYAPKLKKRTALFEKLREIFRQHVSWPVEIVIAKINPILRGWVNYFRIGHSSSCFYMVKRWVEKKVRQHLMRARGRKGFGWKRWSSEWLYDRLGCRVIDCVPGRFSTRTRIQLNPRPVLRERVDRHFWFQRHFMAFDSGPSRGSDMAPIASHCRVSSRHS
jgi:RNA-directed DNA polymerase